MVGGRKGEGVRRFGNLASELSYKTWQDGWGGCIITRLPGVDDTRTCEHRCSSGTAFRFGPKKASLIHMTARVSRHKIVQMPDFPLFLLRRGLVGGSRGPRGGPGICARAWSLRMICLQRSVKASSTLARRRAEVS